MKRIIYDGDPGIDDALAILLALKSPELKLEAITTVGGNVTVEQATQNALKILELAQNEDVRVAKGTQRQGIKTATEFHGEDGLGNTNLPACKRSIIDMSAADLIITEIMKEKYNVSLVTAGPLTNLVKALEEEPRIKDYVSEVIIMGGAVKVPGNITPVAEFNIYNDPEAAKKVFASGLPITLVSLDVTTKVVLKPHHLADIERANTRLTNFLGRMVRFHMEACKMFENVDGCCLHDPLAVGIAIDKNLANTEMVYVDVETCQYASTRGMTWADLRPKPSNIPNLKYCSHVYSDKFIDMFINRLKS